MSMSHYSRPFHPELLSTNSSFHSFTSSGSIDSTANAIESTGVREWIQGPSGRALRLSESSGIDYWIALGTSTVTCSTAGNAMLMLGGTVEIVRVTPNQTYIALQSISTSTAAQVNITLGRGQ